MDTIQLKSGTGFNSEMLWDIILLIRISSTELWSYIGKTQMVHSQVAFVFAFSNNLATAFFRSSFNGAM